MMNVVVVIDQYVEEVGFLVGLCDYVVCVFYYDLVYLLDFDNWIEVYLDVLQIGGLRSLDLVLKVLDINVEGEVFVVVILVFCGMNGIVLVQLCEYLWCFFEGV